MQRFRDQGRRNQNRKQQHPVAAEPADGHLYQISNFWRRDRRDRREGEKRSRGGQGTGEGR